MYLHYRIYTIAFTLSHLHSSHLHHRIYTHRIYTHRIYTHRIHYASPHRNYLTRCRANKPPNRRVFCFVVVRDCRVELNDRLVE